jgi:hypothetical protein
LRPLLILLLLVTFAQGMAHARAASLTFDEGPHLAVGYATLRAGDLRLQPVHIHPPLANVLAAAPLLLQDDLPDPREIDGWEGASLSAVTDEVVWQYEAPARIATAGRVPILLLGVLLGAIVARWAADYGGALAAAVALLLFAFDPNLVAHASLITTDGAAVALIAATLFVLDRYRRGPRGELFVAAGILMGLAQLAKVSALMLVPVSGLLLLVEALEREGWDVRAILHAALRLALLLSIAALVLWAGYGFELRALPDLPIPVPAATHLRIYRSLREHYELGHPTFLAGRVSDHGWPWYFPVAFLLKTPLPALILGAVTLFLGTRRMTYPVLRKKQPPLLSHPYSLLPVLLFPLIYAASSLFSTVNIGYRHLLPLLPFLYVGIGAALSPLLTCSVTCARDYALYVAAGFLAFWLVGATLAVAPHYLTFFNALAGGPEGGYRYLVDSNLDWGQNLWDLREWMDEEGYESVYYAHYSPARPSAYGLDADFLPPDPRAVPFAPWDPAPGAYAIGATVLQGPYAPNVNTYAWFRAREPLDRLGNALFLYEVEEPRAPDFASLCASPAPVVDEARVRAATAQPDLLTAPIDCRAAWYYPAEGVGLHVLLPEAPPPPNASLELEGRAREGDVAYRVYRTAGQPAPPRGSGARIHGPLTFLGYGLDEGKARAGEVVELRTYWRVEKLAEGPLSIMAHLVGPDGVPVAVGDGLGVPLHAWVKGAVIVQRHPLAMPEGTPPGAYRLQTGAYWLDTMDRWAWEGAEDDHLRLPPIEVRP